MPGLVQAHRKGGGPGGQDPPKFGKGRGSENISIPRILKSDKIFKDFKHVKGKYKDMKKILSPD